MSSAGTPATSLLTQIQKDLSGAEAWAASEVAGVGATLWSIFKGAFLSLVPAEAQVVVNVLSRLQSDVIAGKAIEAIETDLLNEALADELAVLQKIGSATLQALIAAWKAS